MSFSYTQPTGFWHSTSNIARYSWVLINTKTWSCSVQTEKTLNIVLTKTENNNNKKTEKKCQWTIQPFHGKPLKKISQEYPGHINKDAPLFFISMLFSSYGCFPTSATRVKQVIMLLWTDVRQWQDFFWICLKWILS